MLRIRMVWIQLLSWYWLVLGRGLRDEATEGRGKDGGGKEQRMEDTGEGR